MHCKILEVILLLGASATATKVTNCTSFDSSVNKFSSTFREPQPPALHSDFTANFIQHKWNEELSHITAGWIEFSAKNKFVRADEATDGYLASSFFDYNNVTADGMVNNVLTTYTANSSTPDVWTGYVVSAFPIFERDFLANSSAVFGGLVERPFFDEQIASWEVVYGGQVPTTVYTTSCGVVVGYDFFSPDLRTKAITEFFNVNVQ